MEAESLKFAVFIPVGTGFGVTCQSWARDRLAFSTWNHHSLFRLIDSIGRYDSEIS